MSCHVKPWPPYSAGRSSPPMRSPPPPSAPTWPAPIATTAPRGPASGPPTFFQAHTRQRHEQVRHGDQRHVVVPPDPRPRLVLRHPQVGLRVSEEFLHPVAR